MGARMPPPLVRATTFSAGTPMSSPPLVAYHRIASVIRLPKLVSSVRLPGSRSPLSRTSVTAKVAPYSFSISARISAARAAGAESSGTAMASVATVSVVISPSLIVTTPMLLNFSPVEVTTVSPTLRSSLVTAAILSKVEWEWPSINRSMPVTLASRSMERLALAAVSSSMPRWPRQMM